jgi:hypothetical protein
MLVRTYGLFWRADEVDWRPGRGVPWRMPGRRGFNRPGVKISDFRDQRGIYVLYGNYGPRYVGLARDRGIGDRLKDHMSDRHEGKWDRFCWFGFRRVLERRDAATGMHELASPANYAVGDVNSVIADMEAMLIKAMGFPHNFNEMNFPNGQEWLQVSRLEISRGLLDRADVKLR